MGKPLPPDEMKLYRLVDEILFYKWDPIGISDSPWVRDEYQAYLPNIFLMVNEKKSAKEIAKHLSEIRSGAMGLSFSQENEDLKTAELLLKTKEFLNR